MCVCSLLQLYIGCLGWVQSLILHSPGPFPRQQAAAEAAGNSQASNDGRCFFSSLRPPPPRTLHIKVCNVHAPSPPPPAGVSKIKSWHRTLCVCVCVCAQISRARVLYTARHVYTVHMPRRDDNCTTTRCAYKAWKSLSDPPRPYSYILSTLPTPTWQCPGNKFKAGGNDRVTVKILTRPGRIDSFGIKHLGGWAREGGREGGEATELMGGVRRLTKICCTPPRSTMPAASLALICPPDGNKYNLPSSCVLRLLRGRNGSGAAPHCPQSRVQPSGGGGREKKKNLITPSSFPYWQDAKQNAINGHMRVLKPSTHFVLATLSDACVCVCVCVCTLSPLSLSLILCPTKLVWTYDT